MQTQPVLDQFNDDFVRDEATASERFGSLLPQGRSEISFTAQDSARRSDRKAELARNHFRLGPFPGTRRAEKNEPPFHSRRLLKNSAAPRERCLGWMARRERRACPQSPVRSKQRRQTAQSALALRVVPLFRLFGVARRLQIAGDMLSPRALERRKIGNNAAWLNFSTGSLSPVKKKGDPGDHDDRDPHIEPHEGAAGCCLTPSVRSAIK